VIAQLDTSRYAFFRGKTDLAPEPTPEVPQPAAQPSPKASKKPAPSKSLEGELLEELQKTNVRFQKGQVEQLQQMYDSQEKGVKAHKAF